MRQSWDAARYGMFSEQRMRPGLDLLARIPTADPETVVDLGCGTGSLTEVLSKRWPQARMIGVDASQEMLAKARSTTAGIEWQETDIAEWQPEAPVDVIYSNAAFHWVGDHAYLFPRLLSYLTQGGCLAVQMPDNWDQPSHTIPEHMLESPEWSEAARAAFLRRPVAAVSDYRRWLGGATSLEVWRTTYYQNLVGERPVLEWVRGSVLAPVAATMEEGTRQVFEDRLADAYGVAYPPEPDGTTLFPFSRLFMLALR